MIKNIILIKTIKNLCTNARSYAALTSQMINNILLHATGNIFSVESLLVRP